MNRAFGPQTWIASRTPHFDARTISAAAPMGRFRESSRALAEVTDSQACRDRGLALRRLHILPDRRKHRFQRFPRRGADVGGDPRDQADDHRDVAAETRGFALDNHALVRLFEPPPADQSREVAAVLSGRLLTLVRRARVRQFGDLRRLASAPDAPISLG